MNTKSTASGVMADKMVRKHVVGFRLSDGAKAALEDAAKADRRSVSAYVEMLIVNDLESRGFLPKGAAE